MSIKCSLLGHRFDETSVEREREEEGSEVVITITEMETCTRCGETRVVSENKEVTTMETPDDPSAGTGTGSGSGAAAGTASGSADAGEGDDYDPDGDDAEIIDDAGAEADAQAEARGGASIPDAETDAGASEAPGDEGDAVIIDDDPVGTDAPAEGGQAAERGDTGASGESEPGAWPGEDEDEDVAEAGASAGSPPAGESDGEWPEEPTRTEGAEESMEEWPDETKRDASGDASAAGPTLEESASPTITVPEGMFKCSECGFTTEVASSSLRAGDFCPECHRGTLVQHEDADE